jgi:hypothetical protein
MFIVTLQTMQVIRSVSGLISSFALFISFAFAISLKDFQAGRKVN